MTSSEIRQSFLDFFKSKQHTIVPSSSLLPDSPNLLFTNAGMNQFVPIFLGQQKPDVDKWPSAIPGLSTRAADTQKCIRAGGKHNDLDDVGLDTYHHTFFEMLGNWSFGDYFKREAIDWAWELVVNTWNFPPQRIYATVFCPDMDLWQTSLAHAVEFARIRLKGGKPEGFGDEVTSGAKGSDAINWPDDEAASYWAEHFIRAGQDPMIHIIPGNRKDNFWMMGETGPCGPCSEIHVDLTPQGDTRGSLVNKGDARCIEIWNLVFIQFNANPGPTYSPLPARHVDTGMGFERVTSIMQCTRNFTDFSRVVSNYETDIFRPLFDNIEQLSGKKYGSTLPNVGQASRLSPKTDGQTNGADTTAEGGDAGLVGDRRDARPTLGSTSTEQEKIDIAFRVIADHIRTLSFAIADGIQPGNTDRNYVLRRILRRAVRYGRTLDFHEPFFYKLVDVVADTMGDVFPEIRAKKKHVQEVIRAEEEAFNKTCDTGTDWNFRVLERQQMWVGYAVRLEKSIAEQGTDKLGVAKLTALLKSPTTPHTTDPFFRFFSDEFVECLRVFEQSPDVGQILAAVSKLKQEAKRVSGRAAFALYDTYGFPLDLTELMARERGLTVDKEGFEKLMEEQRARARAAQKKEVIAVEESHNIHTRFVGFEQLESEATLETFVTVGGSATGAGPKTFAAVVNVSPLYAEMGGQVGDTGWLYRGDDPNPIRILNTVKRGNAFYLQVDIGSHAMPGSSFPPPVEVPGEHVRLVVDRERRKTIERHHTVTHLLHWALHKVVSREVSQKGSFVGADKLTFDFNSAPLTPQQVADIEKLVNERILENAGVSWTEVPYPDVKNRNEVMQFFGDKYGDTVRVVQIGGHAAKLDGYSMELCGGTHTRATGEIGLFRIVGESAIAAGVRRIEAVAGLEAYRRATDEVALIKALAGKVNSPVHELDKKIEALLEHQKQLEKALNTAQQKEAANTAKALLAKAEFIEPAVSQPPLRAIIENLGVADGDYLQAVADSLKGQFKGVVVLGGVNNGAVALVASVSPEFIAKVQAGKIIQTIAPIVGGKGGGKPDNARGGGKDATKLDEALAKARMLVAGG